jgi:alpha-tubulin suppressor-like RCC1 family protein
VGESKFPPRQRNHMKRNWATKEMKPVETNCWRAMTHTIRALALVLCSWLAMPAPVQAQAPSFLLQPTNRNICVGFNTTFAAVASGSTPLRYQWLRNGTPIQDATNSSFTLSNLTFSDAATLQVVVTNTLGSTPSSNAVLVVDRVAAWGLATGGGLAIPLNFTNLTALVTGPGHRLGLRPDGTLVTWVGNPPAGLSNVVQAAAGGSSDAYGLALKADGTVVAWGQSSYGATNIPAGLTNVVKVAAGARHALAMRANGTILGWGDSSGNVRNLSSLLDRFTDVAAGYEHSATLTRDGRVQTYGSNSQGQQNIPPTATNVIAVVCGAYHTLALKADGTVVGWGQNTSGQCNVPVGLSNAVAIATSSSSSFAITQDGAVVSWGDNSTGQRNTPAAFTNAVMIASEGARTFGLRGLGEPWITVQPRNQGIITGNPISLHARAVGNPPLAYQWLSNGAELAGATNASLTIAELQSTNAGNYQLVVSNALGVVTSTVATVTVRQQLGIAAWGLNGYGQNHPPVGLRNIKQIAVGAYHTLALQDDGTLVAWGVDSSGQAVVPPTLTNVVAIAAGGHSMAIRNDGKVVAWGSAFLGTVTNVPTMSTEAVAISAGSTHCLALLANGNTVGWGANGSGSSISHPQWFGIKAIAAGDNHSLGLKADGTLVNYQFGDTSGYTPLIPPAGLSNVVAISCGGYFDMALKSDGTVVAWGNNGAGQTNVPAGLSNVVAISAGATHAAALQADGTLVCWGANANGQCTIPTNLTNVFYLQSGIARTVALVGDGFPVISMQPRSRGLLVDRPIELRVTATGTAPLNCQWHFNGAALTGETNTFLTISNMQPAHIGDYRVTVSNSLGVVTSQAARLNTTLVFAWGGNDSEQCFVPPDATNVANVAAGGWHSLARRNDGTVIGWGANYIGESQPPSSATNISFLTAGGSSSLGLRSDGSMIGWGDNYYGQLTPPSQASNTISLAVYQHTVALQADGRVQAWGWNQSGQTNVPSDLTNAVSVAAFAAASLALRDNGTITVWGSQSSPAGISNVVTIAASFGGLGLRADGTIAPWSNGAVSPASATNVVAIAAGFRNLALRNDGSLVGWSSGSGSLLPPPAGLSNVISIAVGSSFNLVLIGDGKPVITVQPFKRTVVAGSPTTLAVMAVGNQPMSYQWLFNGTNLLGATSSMLTLTNISLTQTGSFQCIVSNALGVVTSAVANLTVTRPPIQFSIAPTATLVTNGVFQTRLTGLSGAGPVTILVSTNLVNWQPVFTNPPTAGSFDFTDSTITNSPLRYYRAMEGP